MPTYIALIHQNPYGSFQVTFPDIRGLTTAGEDLDEAIEEAEEALEHAADHWINPDGSSGLPSPRTIDQLHDDPTFADAADGGIVVEIDYDTAK